MNLQDVFDKQIEFNERCVPGLYEITKDPSKLRDWFLKFNLAMVQENSELIDSLHWKWWKAGNDDIKNAKIELIDILHFWVSQCTLLGMDANEVFELYAKKNSLNHSRQDGGYKTGEYKKIINGVEDNATL